VAAEDALDRAARSSRRRPGSQSYPGREVDEPVGVAVAEVAGPVPPVTDAGPVGLVIFQ